MWSCPGLVDMSELGEEKEALLAAGVNCTNVADENCTLGPYQKAAELTE